MDLGRKIRALRDAKGYSLRAFANKCSMSPSFLSDIELNKSNPSLEMLSIISRELEVSSGDLLDDSNPRETSESSHSA